MQPGHTLIDPPRADHAVLSHRALEHLDHLRKLNLPPFDQARQHADVLQDRTCPGQRFGLNWRRCRCQRGNFASPRIQGLLLHLALRFAIIRHAAPSRLPLPMRVPAAEGTAQIVPPSVAPVSEKEDPAVPAPGQALPQPGLVPQHRAQHHVIRQHQPGDLRSAIPPPPKPKTRRNIGCINPRLSL